MREGAARAEASDGAALPAIVTVGPPVKHGPAHHRSAQVAGRRRLDREASRRDLGWRDGGAGRRWRRRSGKGATGRLLEGSNGVLAVGQVVKWLPRVARRVQAGPAHKYVRPAIRILNLAAPAPRARARRPGRPLAVVGRHPSRRGGQVVGDRGAGDSGKTRHVASTSPALPQSRAPSAARQRRWTPLGRPGRVQQRGSGGGRAGRGRRRRACKPTPRGEAESLITNFTSGTRVGQS